MDAAPFVRGGALAYDSLASGNVQTIPLFFALNGALPLSAGTLYGVRAVCRKAGTYKSIRFCIGTAAPGAVTDVKGGVWTPDGATVLAQTYNMAGETTAANLMIGQPGNLNGGAGLALAFGQEVLIGLGYVGTSLQVRGTVASSISGLVTINTLGTNVTPGGRWLRNATGWAGGALAPLPIEGSNWIPWLDLQPA